MLRQPAEFPHPGSTAFLAPHGEEVRILQRKGADEVLIAHQRHPALRSASDNRTVALAHLHQTQEAAIGLKPRGRGATRSGATTNARGSRRRKAA